MAYPREGLAELNACFSASSCLIVLAVIAVRLDNVLRCIRAKCKRNKCLLFLLAVA